MKKKALSILLTLAMVVSLFSGLGLTAFAITGSGTELDPWDISGSDAGDSVMAWLEETATDEYTLYIEGVGSTVNYDSSSCYSAPWDSYRHKITAIEVTTTDPDGKISIGDCLCYEMDYCESVVFHGDVDKIGGYAFYDVAYYVGYDSDAAITLLAEGDVGTIGYEAFGGFAAYSGYTADTNVTVEVTFAGDVGLIDEYGLYICWYPYYGNVDIDITFQGSVTTVGEYALSYIAYEAYGNCELTITFEGDVDSIGESAFCEVAYGAAYNSSATEESPSTADVDLIFKGDIGYIDGYAFECFGYYAGYYENNNADFNLVFEGDIEEIEDYAFYDMLYDAGCYGGEINVNLEFNGDIGVIGEYAFDEVLYYATYDGGKADVDIAFRGDIGAIEYYAFYDLLEYAYCDGPDSSLDFNMEFFGKIGSIADYAFENLCYKGGYIGESKINLHFYDDIGYIGYEAFAYAFENAGECGRGNTVTITFDGDIDEIADYAFYEVAYYMGEQGNDASLSFTFNGDIGRIGYEAFAYVGYYVGQNCTEPDCSDYTGSLDFTFNGDVGVIDPYVFSDIADYGPLNITFNGSIGTISPNAFYNSGKVARLGIYGGVEAIGTYAFEYFGDFSSEITFENGATDVVLPETLKYIGDYAFCDSPLYDADVTLPEGIRGVGQEAFDSSVMGGLTVTEDWDTIPVDLLPTPAPSPDPDISVSVTDLDGDDADLRSGQLLVVDVINDSEDYADEDLFINVYCSSSTAMLWNTPDGASAIGYYGENVLSRSMKYFTVGYNSSAVEVTIAVFARSFDDSGDLVITQVATDTVELAAADYEKEIEDLALVLYPDETSSVGRLLGGAGFVHSLGSPLVYAYDDEYDYNISDADVIAPIDGWFAALTALEPGSSDLTIYEIYNDESVRGNFYKYYVPATAYVIEEPTISAEANEITLTGLPTGGNWECTLVGSTVAEPNVIKAVPASGELTFSDLKLDVEYTILLSVADSNSTFKFFKAATARIPAEAPAAVADLVCTGEALALITAGSEGLEYAIGTSSTIAPTDGWSTGIPTGIDAGDYYVWYRTPADSIYIEAQGVVTVTIAAHKLTEHPATDATCTTDGNTAYWSCSVCGKYFADADASEEIAENSWVIPAAHKLTEHPAAEPTYESDGNTAYWSCSACGKFFSDAAATTEIAEDSWIIPALIPDAVIYGDVNGDTDVTAKDNILLARYVAEWSGITIDVAAADVNNDGAVNAKDVIILARHIAGWTGYETLPH